MKPITKRYEHQQFYSVTNPAGIVPLPFIPFSHSYCMFLHVRHCFIGAATYCHTNAQTHTAAWSRSQHSLRQSKRDGIIFVHTVTIQHIPMANVRCDALLYSRVTSADRMEIEEKWNEYVLIAGNTLTSQCIGIHMISSMYAYPVYVRASAPYAKRFEY